mmetsp:Transcript_7976/g.20477  ORF Transcript_7976/g.20477 Transcript_7976/m.20477 type:complete len:205 (+) Transcript_7976:83-697(+)
MLNRLQGTGLFAAVQRVARQHVVIIIYQPRPARGATDDTRSRARHRALFVDIKTTTGTTSGPAHGTPPTPTDKYRPRSPLSNNVPDQPGFWRRHCCKKWQKNSEQKGRDSTPCPPSHSQPWPGHACRLRWQRPHAAGLAPGTQMHVLLLPLPGGSVQPEDSGHGWRRKMVQPLPRRASSACPTSISWSRSSTQTPTWPRAPARP